MGAVQGRTRVGNGLTGERAAGSARTNRPRALPGNQGGEKEAIPE